MIEYEALFADFRALVRGSEDPDFDAPEGLEASFAARSADEKAEFVEALCGRAGAHVVELGTEEVGALLTHLLGSHWQIWWDVVEARPETAEAAILALDDLYGHCFARHAPAWCGGDASGGRLGLACHMLWDMDGGLDRIPKHGTPRRLVPACYEVLEHALSLDAPSCWESALHGLGHIAFTHPQPAGRLIDGFLASRKGRLPEHVVRYALAARSGAVQ